MSKRPRFVSDATAISSNMTSRQCQEAALAAIKAALVQADLQQQQEETQSQAHLLQTTPSAQHRKRLLEANGDLERANVDELAQLLMAADTSPSDRLRVIEGLRKRPETREALAAVLLSLDVRKWGLDRAVLFDQHQLVLFDSFLHRLLSVTGTYEKCLLQLTEDLRSLCDITAQRWLVRRLCDMQSHLKETVPAFRVCNETIKFLLSSNLLNVNALQAMRVDLIPRASASFIRRHMALCRSRLLLVHQDQSESSSLQSHAKQDELQLLEWSFTEKEVSQHLPVLAELVQFFGEEGVVEQLEQFLQQPLHYCKTVLLYFVAAVQVGFATTIQDRLRRLWLDTLPQSPGNPMLVLHILLIFRHLVEQCKLEFPSYRVIFAGLVAVSLKELTVDDQTVTTEVVRPMSVGDVLQAATTALTLSVPFDTPLVLKPQLDVLREYQRQHMHVRDYIELACARMADFGGTSIVGVADSFAYDGSSASTEVRGVIAKALSEFSAKDGRVPHALVMLSLFRRVYFLKEVLPALLTVEEPAAEPNDVTVKEQLIRALDVAGYIPVQMMTAFQSAKAAATTMDNDGIVIVEDSITIASVCERLQRLFLEIISGSKTAASSSIMLDSLFSRIRSACNSLFPNMKSLTSCRHHSGCVMHGTRPTTDLLQLVDAIFNGVFAVFEHLTLAQPNPHEQEPITTQQWIREVAHFLGAMSYMHVTILVRIYDWLVDLPLETDTPSLSMLQLSALGELCAHMCVWWPAVHVKSKPRQSFLDILAMELSVPVNSARQQSSLVFFAGLWNAALGGQFEACYTTWVESAPTKDGKPVAYVPLTAGLTLQFLVERFLWSTKRHTQLCSSSTFSLKWTNFAQQVVVKVVPLLKRSCPALICAREWFYREVFVDPQRDVLDHGARQAYLQWRVAADLELGFSQQEQVESFIRAFLEQVLCQSAGGMSCVLTSSDLSVKQPHQSHCRSSEPLMLRILESSAAALVASGTWDDRRFLTQLRMFAMTNRLEASAADRLTIVLLTLPPQLVFDRSVIDERDAVAILTDLMGLYEAHLHSSQSLLGIAVRIAQILHVWNPVLVDAILVQFPLLVGVLVEHWQMAQVVLPNLQLAGVVELIDCCLNAFDEEVVAQSWSRLALLWRSHALIAECLVGKFESLLHSCDHNTVTLMAHRCVQSLSPLEADEKLAMVQSLFERVLFRMCSTVRSAATCSVSMTTRPCSLVVLARTILRAYPVEVMTCHCSREKTEITRLLPVVYFALLCSEFNDVPNCPGSVLMRHYIDLVKLCDDLDNQVSEAVRALFLRHQCQMKQQAPTSLAWLIHSAKKFIERQRYTRVNLTTELLRELFVADAELHRFIQTTKPAGSSQARGSQP